MGVSEESRFEHFTALVANLNRSIRKIKSEEMQEFDLKSTHVSLLYYLQKKGAISASELCELCEEDKANVSRSIDHLEKRGYIVAREGSRKRYRAPLELSPAGKEVAERIAEKIDGILKIASEQLPEEERTVMYKSMARINDTLQKICDEYENRNKKDE